MSEPRERVTVVRTDTASVPGGGTLAVLTLAPEDGTERPTSLGLTGLANLTAAAREAAERARAGEVDGVVVTGTGPTFLAGADLGVIRTIPDRETALGLARAGHAAMTALTDLPVPTLAHVNGTALGGGLETALACDYRTVVPTARRLGLPETYLGLLPGWGGCTLLPRLVGADAALRLIVDLPARGNQSVAAQEAAALGLVDAVVPDLDAALAWFAAVLTGHQHPTRRDLDDEATWHAAVEARRPLADARAAGGAPAAARALEVVAASRTRERADSFAAEDEALADLVMTDQLRASLYAFDLLTRRGKRPAGAPEGVAPRPVRRVGVMGAGLMAGQLALVLARSLEVPVLMRDLDEERAARGLAAVHDQVDGLVRRGRLAADRAAHVKDLVSVTTDVADMADADLVLEAVFEEMGVKQQVFAELEAVVRPDAVLATNTSSLSVTGMAATLEHPERVVGLHFFNPVAQMPLVEVVRAPATDDRTWATAFAVAAACRKTAVAVADAPGFVVNRLLLRLLGEVLGALEEGTDIEVADRALRPMGLPMGPFQLLQLVGAAVADHVLAELRTRLGDRYPDSPGLRRIVEEGVPLVEGRPGAASPVRPEIAAYFGSRAVGRPLGEAALAHRVRLALAEETDLMLAEEVAQDAGDIDLAMILGAGWPLHNGGLTPYLDRTGASAEVTGRPFHAPGVASLPVIGAAAG